MCQYCCTCFLFSFLGVVHLFRYFLLYVFVWFRAQVVRFCPFWYKAFDRRRRIVFVATAVWLFFGCWRCRLDYMSQSFLTWEAMRGHITIFVAHKTTPSNTTESSATTAEHRCHMRSFSNTPFAVRQQCSLGGRGEVDVHYKKKLPTTCRGVVITFSWFSWHASIPAAMTFDVGYVSVDPGDRELPSPEA